MEPSHAELLEPVADGEPLPVPPADYFHCAFAIRQLPCELVEAYGDDFAQYLTASDACPWVVAPAGGAL